MSYAKKTLAHDPGPSGRRPATPTTLLKAGRVIDGTGSPAFNGHVLIKDNRIGAVLKQTEPLPAADEVIDASGCAVAPGFIDVHSHMDWSLPLDNHPELLKCLLEQGITTVVAGNCGFSPAPVSTETVGLLDRDFMLPIDKPLDHTWHSMGEFLDAVEEKKPVLNLAQLVGHATLRIAASSTRRGVMRPDDLRDCLLLLKRSLDEGACGLSFGLGYDPGTHSPQQEIEAFSTAAALARKPVTVHLKAYGRLSAAYTPFYFRPHNLRALREMITVARSARASLQISHMMLAFRTTWPKVDNCLGMIDIARAGGVDVMMDAIPYSDVNGGVASLLPPSFVAKLPDGYRSRWARMLVRVQSAIGFRRVGYRYADHCRLMDAGVDGWEDLSGLTIGEIARRWRTSAPDVLLKLCEASNGRAAVLCHDVAGGPGREEHLDAILSHDLCLFATDTLIRRKGYPNPAAYGAFPRILGYYVRQRKLFSIENAIKRMTSASADRFGIKDRGSLEAGKAADVVIFDPDTVAEAAPVGVEPAGRPAGIRHVFVNGVRVVKDGAYVEARAGRVIRV